MELFTVKHQINLLSQYFKGDENLFKEVLEKINQDGYTKENEQELKNILINKVFIKCANVIYRDKIKSNISELYSIIRRYESIKQRVIYNEEIGKYKVYPFDLKYNDNYLLGEYNKVFSEVIDKIVSGYNIESSIDEYTKQYKEKLKTFLKKVNEKHIEPYCGNIEFMTGRVKYIVSCIEEILSSDKIDNEIKNKFIEGYNDIKDYINVMEKYPKEDKYKDYEVKERIYKLILKEEEKLSTNMQSIWDKYLTDPKDFKEGEPFKFLIHTLTSGYAETDKLSKACTTLVTEKCMPIPYGNYGYIMEFDASNIGTMCKEDAGSWTMTEYEFINRELPSSWQAYEKVGDIYVWYETNQLSKLILPWNIEKQMVETSEKYYGGALSEHNRYSEIFMQSNKGPLKSKGMFYKNELGLEKIQEHNIKDTPIVEIDLNTYRELNGLPPIENSKVR